MATSYNIDYQFDEVDYSVDGSAQAVVDNLGTSGAANDLSPYSGRGLDLTGGATVDIPIVYTLGADAFTSMVSPAAPVVVSGTNVTCDGTGTDSWDSGRLDLNTTSVTWSHRFMAYVEVTVTINSGTFTITGYDAGFSLTQLDTPITLTSGVNKFKIYGVAADTKVSLLVNGSVAFDVDLTPLTVKDFSTQNSYVTVFDPLTGTVTQENMHLGDQVLSNNDFTNGLTDWSVQAPAAYEVGTFYGRTNVLKVTTTDVVSGNRVTHDVSWLKGPYEVDTEAYIESGSLKIDGSDGYWVGEGAGAYDPISTATPTGQWTRFTEVGVALLDIAHQIWVRSQTGASAVAYLDWIALRQIKQPVFTKQFSLTTLGMVLAHASPFSDADLAAIAAAPYKLAMLAAGETGHGLSITLGSNDKFFPFMEPSGSTVYNSRNKSETATITGYAETVRTNADQLRKGLQGRYLSVDVDGAVTGTNFGFGNYRGLSFDDTYWNPSLESQFAISEVVGTTHYSHIYNGTTLTTWTNGVEGSPVSHTPENATYLLGKGAYPKVAADPLATYTQDFFKVAMGTAANGYDPVLEYENYTGVRFGSIAISSSSTLAVSGTVVPAGVDVFGGVALSSTSTQTVTPIADLSGSVTLSNPTLMAVTALLDLGVSAVLTSDSVQGVIATVDHAGTIPLSSVSVFTIDGSLDHNASVSLASASAVSITGESSNAPSVSLTSQSTIDISAEIVLLGVLSLDSGSTMVAVGYIVGAELGEPLETLYADVEIVVLDADISKNILVCDVDKPVLDANMTKPLLVANAIYLPI